MKVYAGAALVLASATTAEKLGDGFLGNMLSKLGDRKPGPVTDFLQNIGETIGQFSNLQVDNDKGPVRGIFEKNGNSIGENGNVQPGPVLSTLKKIGGAIPRRVDPSVNGQQGPLLSALQNLASTLQTSENGPGSILNTLLGPLSELGQSIFSGGMGNQDVLNVLAGLGETFTNGQGLGGMGNVDVLNVLAGLGGQGLPGSAPFGGALDANTVNMLRQVGTSLMASFASGESIVNADTLSMLMQLGMQLSSSFANSQGGQGGAGLPPMVGDILGGQGGQSEMIRLLFQRIFTTLGSRTGYKLPEGTTFEKALMETSTDDLLSMAGVTPEQIEYLGKMTDEEFEEIFEQTGAITDPTDPSNSASTWGPVSVCVGALSSLVSVSYY